MALFAVARGFLSERAESKRRTSFASRQFDTIELNGSFYSLQTPESYRRWYSSTPKHFKFAIKGPRYITHSRRLEEVTAPLGNFFASGLLHLQHKLGPFLWQLPPSFRFHAELLQIFFDLLPRTVSEAVKLSHKADRLEPNFPKSALSSKEPLRHALEVRHHSFENPDFIELLKKNKIALVFADTAGKWPYMEDVTADFLYLRLHGEKKIYSSGYGKESLRFWARRIGKWREGDQAHDALTITDEIPRHRPHDIYVYFDNDVKVRAPFDAQELTKMVS